MLFKKNFFILLLIGGLLAPTLALKMPVRADDDYWPTTGWRTSTPEEQGLDSVQLMQVLDFMEENEIASPVNSVLVVRNGYVVLDASMPPFASDQPRAIYAVTKSFLATLVGIAIDKGYIQGVDQSIWEFFDPTTVANLDASKQAITLRDLLTMKSGLSTTDADLDMYRLGPDDPAWVQFILDRPMEAERVFSDCDCVAQLVSAIISQATGMSAFDFAQANLFEPLGIHDALWLADPQGVSVGGEGLYISLYDMAKLGYLYLQGGVWDGQQIVAREWVEMASSNIACSGCSEYDYYWWRGNRQDLPPDFPEYYYAAGDGGQYILVVPEKNLIFVMTGDSRGSVLNEYPLFVQTLMPALLADEPLPANPEAATALAQHAEALTHPQPETVPPAPAIVQQVTGQTYNLSENPMGWTTASIEFGETEGLLSLTTADGLLELPIGLDGLFRITPVTRPAILLTLRSDFWAIPRITDVALALKGYWRNDTTFLVNMRDDAGLESWVLQFSYKDNALTLMAVESLQRFNLQINGTPLG